MQLTEQRTVSPYRAIDFDLRKVDEIERNAAGVWICSCADLLESFGAGSPDEQAFARFLRQKSWWRERNVAQEHVFPRSNRTRSQWAKRGTLRRLRDVCVARLTDGRGQSTGLATFRARQRALSWRMSWAEWKSLLARIDVTDDVTAGISFFFLRWCIPADGTVVARQATPSRFKARFWQYPRGSALFSPARLENTLGELCRHRRDVDITEVCALRRIPLSASAVVAEVLRRSSTYIVFFQGSSIVVRQVVPRRTKLSRRLELVQQQLETKPATLPELRDALQQNVSRKALYEILIPANEIFRLDIQRFGTWRSVEERLERMGTAMRDLELTLASVIRPTESAVTAKNVLLRCASADARLKAMNVWLLRSVAARMAQFTLLPYGKIGRRQKSGSAAVSSEPQTVTEHLAPAP